MRLWFGSQGCSAAGVFWRRGGLRRCVREREEERERKGERRWAFVPGDCLFLRRGLLAIVPC